jgi:hypothetical protein
MNSPFSDCWAKPAIPINVSRIVAEALPSWTNVSCGASRNPAPFRSLGRGSRGTGCGFSEFSGKVRQETCVPHSVNLKPRFETGLFCEGGPLEKAEEDWGREKWR